MAMLVPVLAWGQGIEEAADRMAARLASNGVGAAPAALLWQNLSSLSTDDFSAARRVVEQELAKEGLTISDTAETKLRLTISEDPRECLLVAEPPNVPPIIEPWTPRTGETARPQFHLEQTVLWEQPAPMLDVLLSGDGTRMAVLGPGRVTLYDKSGDGWQGGRMMLFTPPRPVPRDPRGRLIGTGNGYHILLPGAVCEGSWTADTRIRCAESSQPWLVTGRNYFAATNGDYYSLAELPGGAKLVAGVDGRARLYTEATDPAAVIDGWGSDVAAIDSACGSRIQVLATRATRDDEADQLQAFELDGTRMTPVTAPLPLTGTLTAMWRAESPAQVTIIVLNPKTGNYAASRVAVACAE